MASTEDLEKMYPGAANAPAVSVRELVPNGFIHTGHHRAQAEVYLRVKAWGRRGTRCRCQESGVRSRKTQGGGGGAGRA